MAEPRFLIVNADDLGLTQAVNAGIFAAHERGIVTSASLMVLRDGAPAAVAALVEHPELSVGLHLEAGEDLRWQLDLFRQMRGRDPTHLDSHKHVHETEPEVGAAAAGLAAELGVPLRNRAIRYERRFYGRDAISPRDLTELIETLPPSWTEIGCHPAAGPVPTSSYDAERQIELATLTDPQVKNLLNVSDVRLCSFAQAKATRPPTLES
jgi:chitin disaccharide deacetylase